MIVLARKTLKHILGAFGYRLERFNRDYPVLRPLDPKGVEVLADPGFQSSCREISDLTLLDTERLANLWQLCRLSNPEGQIIEVGAYKGGGALHLSNSCPHRKVFICDSFEGFQAIDPKLDNNFSMAMFKDAREQNVRQLFESRKRKFEVIRGFFPQSCQGINLRPISFAHVDVDTYKATIETLLFLHEAMIEKSFIVLDDYNRRAEGVNKAIIELVSTRRQWIAIPMFPSQAVLIHQSWFS